MLLPPKIPSFYPWQGIAAGMLVQGGSSCGSGAGRGLFQGDKELPGAGKVLLRLQRDLGCPEGHRVLSKSPGAPGSCTQGCTSPGWLGRDGALQHTVSHTHTRVLLLFKATRDSLKVLIVVAAELSVIEKQL